jgi:hypothetical protein
MWYEEAVFYQVFPLGFCDGLRDNDEQMHIRICRLDTAFAEVRN